MKKSSPGSCTSTLEKRQHSRWKLSGIREGSIPFGQSFTFTSQKTVAMSWAPRKLHLDQHLLSSSPRARTISQKKGHTISERWNPTSSEMFWTFSAAGWTQATPSKTTSGLVNSSQLWSSWQASSKWESLANSKSTSKIQRSVTMIASSRWECTRTKFLSALCTNILKTSRGSELCTIDSQYGWMK